MKLSDHISGIKPALAALLTGCLALLTACSSGGDKPLPEPAEPAEIGFMIEVGESFNSDERTSRATPEGDYDPGQGYENYVDISGGDFRFYLINPADDTYASIFDVTSIIPVSSSSSSKTYQVLGRFNGSDDIQAENLKILVLANWRGNYPDGSSLVAGVTTMNDIVSSAQAVYTFTREDMGLSASRPIPLFGVKSFPKVEYDASNFAMLGRIHLLRAYAKIEVECPSDKWTMTSCLLSRYNTRGMRAPLGVKDEDDYVKNNYDKDYVDRLSIPANTPAAENLPFLRLDRNHYLAYVPEYANTTASGELAVDHAFISVSFEDSNFDRQFIDFKYYQNPPEGVEVGSPFDIRRNYYYKFTIDKHDEVSQITVIVDVVPYGEVKLDPIFGIDPK